MNFFESIYIINLPQATKRLEKIKKELKNIDTISYKIFSGIDGQKDVDSSIWKKFHDNLHHINSSSQEAFDRLHKGQAGAYLSHYHAILEVKEAFERAQKEFEQAKANYDEEKISYAIAQMRKHSRVLIIEDDTGFGILDENQKTVSRHNAGYYLRKAMLDVPDDWDLLYFIVQPTEPTMQISPYLYKLNYAWSLCCYAIHYPMYEPLIEQLKKIEDPGVTKIFPVDNEIGLIHHLHKVYAIYPSLAYTHSGPSFVTGLQWDLPWQGQPKFP